MVKHGAVDLVRQAMTEKLFETLKGSAQGLKSTHLRELLKDEARRMLMVEPSCDLAKTLPRLPCLRVKVTSHDEQ